MELSRARSVSAHEIDTIVVAGLREHLGGSDEPVGERELIDNHVERNDPVRR